MNTSSIDVNIWQSLALLGKTAGVLSLVVVTILGLAYIFTRLSGHKAVAGGARIRVVSSAHVGPRERIVIVQVDHTRLLLGVASGRVVKLHELPDHEPSYADDEDTPSVPSFRTRLSSALGRNLTKRQ